MLAVSFCNSLLNCPIYDCFNRIGHMIQSKPFEELDQAHLKGKLSKYLISKAGRYDIHVDKVKNEKGSAIIKIV